MWLGAVLGFGSTHREQFIHHCVTGHTLRRLDHAKLEGELGVHQRQHRDVIMAAIEYELRRDRAKAAPKHKR